MKKTLVVFETFWSSVAKSGFVIFIKKHWLGLLAFVAGVFAAVKLMKNKHDAVVKLSKKQTDDEITRAEKEEKGKVKDAITNATAEKSARDKEIKQTYVENVVKINEEVKQNIKETLGNTESKQAQDFATAFGGTYVKNDEK
jgi:vacuolar-type H+-ATPase subunit H